MLKNEPLKSFDLESLGTVCYRWEGLIPFEKSLEIQTQLKQTAKRSQFCFLGFESLKPVISLGLRADASHIVWSSKKLNQFELSQVKVRRGGEATLHLPGQLVIYPIVHLKSLGFKVKDFIVALQTITQTFFKQENIDTQKGEDFAGLYTKMGKISFFGIHISEGVSQSGLSINVDNSLSLFDSIKSCGQHNRPHDKMAFYKQVKLDRKELFLKWCACAYKYFNKQKTLKKIQA